MKLWLALSMLLVFASVTIAGTFQGDVSHLGNFSQGIEGQIIPKVGWKTYISGLVGAQPVYSNGMIFVTNWYGWGEWNPGLYVLNASNGEIMMSFPEIQGASTAFVYGDKVIVGGMKFNKNSYQGYLYIVNLTSSSVSEVLLDPQESWYGIASSPIVYNESIYVLTHSNGTLWKLSLEGEVIGKFITGGEISPYTSPATIDGLICFAGNKSGNAIFCVDEDLNELFNISVDSKITNTPTLYGDLLIFATEKSLYFVNVTEKRIIKTMNFNGSLSSAAVGDRIYIGSRDGKLYAINKTKLEIDWFFEANGRIDSSPAFADGVVYFATNVREGTIYAVREGKELWHYRLKPPEGSYYNIMSSPFIADGKLFIGTDSGHVYCFNSTGTIEFDVRLAPGKLFIDNIEISGVSALAALYEASKYQLEDAQISFEVKISQFNGNVFVSSIMGLEPTPDWSWWWSIWNSTDPLEVSADAYILKDDETVYYCYGSSANFIHGPENSKVVLKITAKVMPLRITGFEVSDGKRGGNVTASVSIATAEEGWFLVVVSGVSERGDYIAGISTFHLCKGEELTVPVLIHVPQRNEAGNYRLFAAVYRLQDYPNNFIAISQPRVILVG
uniref:Pyrrolo-quinoline quinone n=1 Tax=Archaeoglobus fulgidus TaxID=2234 RepID=A0A7J2TKD5_ARCFL